MLTMILLILFFAAALYCAILFSSFSLRGSAAGVQTHWGGFGGGMTGWTLNPALVYLIGTLVFAGMSTALAMRTIDAMRPGPTTRTSETATATGK